MKKFVLALALLSTLATAAMANQFCYVDQWGLVHCCTPNAYGGCY